MNQSSIETGLNRLQDQLSSRGTARKVIETLVFIALYAVGLIGNFLVLFIVNKKRKEGKMIYLFIGALAISDIFLLTSFAVFSSPAIVLGKWPFPEIVCQLHGFCIIYLGTASLLLMAITALNRYFRVLGTKYYHRLFTTKRTILLILGAWVFATITPIQYLSSGERYIFNPGKCICFMRHKVKASSLYGYVIVFIPIFVIIVCYYKIFKLARSHQVSFQQNSKGIGGPSIHDINITRTLFLTVVGCLCCWTPVLIIDIIDFVQGEFSLPREAYYFYSCVGSSSSVINPFIYGALNPMFREEYKRIMPCGYRNTEVQHMATVPKLVFPSRHIKNADLRNGPNEVEFIHLRYIACKDGTM
ncbi:predicted protein [Nematostella vectensis]|uniref:G-protein coupled receptors family 1 profile domain-containing protein n=1 Tax=Nematostella vectensis TaxID=45351 RepID=A7T1W6_NEMVE|nr:predicted protein [Nematostella vectensis]|eukprot:XP_001622150.1 hypothetical protein NEMVEDRAFT_v1g221092 [Nematostella vectensis]